MDLDEMLRVDRCRNMDELTFEPDPDNSLDAGTGLLYPISYALQRGILLRRKNPTYRYWAAATRGFTMVLFNANHRNNFVGGTCALPSALLVYLVKQQQQSSYIVIQPITTSTSSSSYLFRHKLTT